MAPPRLGEALHERFDGGVEIEEAHLPAALLERGHCLGKTVQSRAALDVECDRYAFLTGTFEIARRIDEQRHRQVVDGVVARILECRQCDALARPRDAADEHQVQLSPRPSASAAAR
jgi:hypothetical protein